ncbi:hypothetical protein D3C80_1886130 [compost metagenome]
MRSRFGFTSRISKLRGWLSALSRRWPLRLQPASFKRPRALRKVSRGMPRPSVLGKLKGSVSSVGGNCSRYGLSNSHSWPTGRPVAANSLLG